MRKLRNTGDHLPTMRAVEDWLRGSGWLDGWVFFNKRVRVVEFKGQPEPTS
jgi:hypothetical protein